MGFKKEKRMASLDMLDCEVATMLMLLWNFCYTSAATVERTEAVSVMMWPPPPRVSPHAAPASPVSPPLPLHLPPLSQHHAIYRAGFDSTA